MFKMIGRKKAERELTALRRSIEEASRRYGMDPLAMESVMLKEMLEIDVADLLADLLVRMYYTRNRLNRSRTGKDLDNRSKRGPSWNLLMKSDSSTGYSQIFARVAILALNYAHKEGLADYAEFGFNENDELEPSSPDDVFRMWKKLKSDKVFNMHMGLLNLISAGEETVGHRRFAEYSAEDMKRMFSRYNSSCGKITQYGEETYTIYAERKKERQEC